MANKISKEELFSREENSSKEEPKQHVYVQTRRTQTNKFKEKVTMRKLLLSYILFFTFFCISAQTTNSHIVKRGETIESIAKMYGITIKDLHDSNPYTKSYFYTGMKLIIPTRLKSEQKSQVQVKDGAEKKEYSSSKPKPSTESKPTEIKPQNEKTNHTIKPKPTPNNKVTPLWNNIRNNSEFSSVGIFFGHDFSDLVGMTYGIQGQYFNDNGFGATLTVGANYGLEKDADLVFRIGPSYVYPLTDMFYLMGSACYTLTMGKYKDKTGTISGFSVIPTFGVVIGDYLISLNGDIHWRNGGKIGPGVYLSVGYAF